MLRRLRPGVVLASVAFSPAALAQGRGESAEAHWNEIAKCAAIDGAEARLACTDNVFRQAGLLDNARLVRQARQEFGNEGREGASSDASSASPRASNPVPSQPTRGRDMSELATTVMATRMKGDRLVVTTAEGSVWEQTQSESFRTIPNAGDAFSIERGALGGFRCSFERSTVYRCRRVD